MGSLEPFDALETRLRTETLEDLARFGNQRGDLVAATVT